MSKNRSIWSVLLAVMLAMVVMAGLAVTAFATTDGGADNTSIPVVDDIDDLAAVLAGTKQPSADINYDVDGNGIVENDDLIVLKYKKGEGEPLADPDDLLDQLTGESKAALQTKIVRGDSVRALAVTGNQSVTLTFASPVDISENQKLVIDTLWPDGAGSFQVVFLSGDKKTAPVTVNASNAGWSAVEVPLAALDSTVTASVTGIQITMGEGSTTYFDNFRAEGTLIRYNVSFEGMDETLEVVVGRPYGELPVPARTFYAFEGWYLNDVKVTADTIVTAEAEHTLSAKFVPLASDDGTITVTDNGNNTFGLAMDGSYKQIRFDFMLKSGDFYMSYVDGDSIGYNNPVITIVDANGNAVSQSKVQPGQWYTAFIYGGAVTAQKGDIKEIQDGAPLATSGTLTISDGVQMQVRNLETLTGQFGVRVIGQSPTLWQMTDSTAVVDGKLVNGYNYHKHQAAAWGSHLGFSVYADRYTKMTFELYIYELNGEAAKGQVTGLELWTEASGAVKLGEPVVYDMDGSEVTTANVQVGNWYKVEIDMTGASGSHFLYSTVSKGDEAEAGTYKAYIANVNFVGDGTMIDNLSPATSVIVDKAGADGTFVTTPVTRDTDRGTYRVAGTSANWYDRAIRVKLNDTTKELIQLDFRFVTSKDASGKDVAPTLVASTGVSGTLTQAQYIILDENDAPVTALETGKWYRMFINANGGNVFGLVPATTGEVELQVEGLDTFNTDELPGDLTVGNTAAGHMSAVLTRFGKLQYIYAGSGSNTVTITLDSALYKQVRFAVKSDSAISLTGAAMEITGSGEWKNVVVSNDGGNLPTTLTLNVGEGSLVIKDLAAYTATETYEEKTQSEIFRGLDDDEMMISGFLGPREEEHFYIARTDQKSNAYASLARDDIFKLIADVGINYISDNQVDYNGSEKENTQHILRLAAKYGINYFVSATDVVEIGVDTGETKEVNYPSIFNPHNQVIYENNIADKDAIKAKLEALYKFESFGGFYFRDEPTSDLFDEIREAVEKVEQAKAEMGDVTLNQYVNLYTWFNTTGALTNFQDYSSPTDKVGNAGYKDKAIKWEEYLTASVLDTGMNYFSFDIYPFNKDSNGETVLQEDFLNHLGLASYAANNVTHTPWMGYAQVGGGEPSYDEDKAIITEAELNWDVNAMLAFGAKGILYYINVTPPYSPFDTSRGEGSGITTPFDPHSLIDASGTPTDYYDYAKDINAQIQAIDHVLMKAQHLGIILNGSGACGYSTASNKTALLDTTAELRTVKLSNVGGTAALIGAFNYNGQTALLVVNNTTDNDGVADGITLNFTGAYSYEVIQDAKTAMSAGTSLNLSLLPGRCALVIVHEGEVSADATVLFDLNYAGAPAYNETRTVSLLGDLVYPALPTPENRTYYTFGGWYADQGCTGDPVVAGQTLVATSDHVLYAKWIFDAAAAGYEFTYPDWGEYYTTVTPVELDGDLAFEYYVRPHGELTGAGDRRVHLSIANKGEKQIISMQVKFTQCSDAGTPAIAIHSAIRDADYNYIKVGQVVTDANGNIVDGNNLELDRWYTVTWITDSADHFQIRPFNGTSVDGTIYMKNITIKDLEGPLANSFFTWVAPFEMGDQTAYMCHARVTGNPAQYTNRVATFSTNAVSGDVISMKVMMTETTGTPLFAVRNASDKEMSIAITAADGNTIDSTAMGLGQWYTVSWIADGSATYQLLAFEGEDVGGTYFVKDIKTYTAAGTALTPDTNATITVKDNAGDLTYLYRTKATNDASSRVFYFHNDGNNQTLTYKLKFNKSQWSGAEGDLCYIRHYNGGFVFPVVTDEEGNEVAQADRQVGVWYNVTFQAPAGTKLPKDIYTYTYSTGSETDVDVELEIKDIVFTPYIASQYDVSFNLNYEGAPAYNETVHVTEGAAYGTLPTPTRQYHTFDGWYADAACENAVTAETVVTATQAHTLYAKWIFDAAAAGAEFTYPSWGNYYTIVTPVEVDSDFAFKFHVKPHGEDTAGWDRRAHMHISNAGGDLISMKVLVANSSNNSTLIDIYNASGTQMTGVFTDAQGNIVEAGALTLGQWYTLSWVGDGSEYYEVHPFEGTAINGTFYMKDISVDTVENPFRVPSASEMYSSNIPESSTGFYSSVSPVMLGNEVGYMHYITPTTAETAGRERRTHLVVTAAAKQIVSMQVYFAACSDGATPSIEILRGDALVLGFVVTDADGNIVDHTDLELNKWYTVAWLADGSEHYQIRPITGSAASGTYYMKNINVRDAGTAGAITGDYHIWVLPVEASGSYMVHARYTNDPTGMSNRQVSLAINSAAGDVITMDVKVAATSGTRKLKVLNAAGTELAITIADAEGHIVDSTAMEFGQWYTLSWVSDGSASYKIQSFEGEKANGTYYVKDINVISFSYTAAEGKYWASVTHAVLDGQGVAKYETSSDNDGRWSSWGTGVTPKIRRVYLNIPHQLGDTISMEVMLSDVRNVDGTNLGTNTLAIHPKDSDTPVAVTFKNAQGNVVADGELTEGVWYTMTFKGSGISTYDIRPFKSSGDMGVLYMKNIQVIEPQMEDDDFNPTLRFAITSDVHVYNYYGGNPMAKYNLGNLFNVAYGYANLSSYKNLDAVLVAGDISEGHVDEFETFKQIVDSKIQNGTQLLVGMGNHDFRKEGGYTDEGALEMEAAFKDVFGLDSTDQHVVINGYHFIVLSPTAENLGLRVGESYSAEKLAWLEAQIQQAVADDATKPVFVMQHHHASDTVYGSDYGTDAMQTHYAQLYDIFAKYPQVVNFSGHSHYPVNDPRNVWQGNATLQDDVWQDAFTAIGTGTLFYVCLDINGGPKEINIDDYLGNNDTPGAVNGEDYGMFQIVEVNGNNDIRIIVYDLRTFTEQYRFVIKNPVDPANHITNEQKAEASVVPEFAEGAEIEIEDVDGVKYVYVPQAVSTEIIESYRAYVTVDGVTTTYYGLSGYVYPNQPEYARIKIGTLDTTKNYRIEVVAVNAYGKTSEPLVLDASIPQMEITFDLNYEGATNAPAAITVAEGAAYGALPVLTKTQSRQDGSLAYTLYYSFAGWYTDPKCEGEPVKATDKPSGDCTLYAKWVEDGFVVRGQESLLSYEYLDGAWVYVRHSVDAYHGDDAHKFDTYHIGPAYAVSFKVKLTNLAEGAVANYQGGSLYTAIYDENGSLVANNVTGGVYQDLTPDVWYTLVITHPSNTNFGPDYWNAGFFGEGTLDVYIKDISVASSIPANDAADRVRFYSQSAIGNANAIPDPVLRWVDGQWMYVYEGSKNTVTEINGRQIGLFAYGNVYNVKFDLMMNNLNGESIAAAILTDAGGYSTNFASYGIVYTIKDAQGNTVTDNFQAGEWYTIEMTGYNGGASSLDPTGGSGDNWRLCTLGTGTGGLDVYIRNVEISTTPIA